jgi:DNA polymerase-3 subunit delta
VTPRTVSPVPAPVTVVVGAEELLAARAVAAVAAEAREAAAAAGTDLDVVDLAAADTDPAALAAAVSPSLFAERRVVVVTGADAADRDLAAALAGYAAAPAADISLVVVHPGGAKGRSLVDGLTTAGARLVECEAPRRPEDRERFVAEEIRAAGGTTDRPAVQALIAAVGTDLRELAAAAAQLVADCGGRVDEDAVARYHLGHAEAGSFAVADRAVEGDRPGALALTRWALLAGQSPAGITGALASNLRTIGLVAGAGRGGSAALGVPPWKARKAAGWARGWHPDALAEAVRAVADADEQVKGGAADAGYAVERAVLAVLTARTARGGRPR